MIPKIRPFLHFYSGQLVDCIRHTGGFPSTVINDAEFQQEVDDGFYKEVTLHLFSLSDLTDEKEFEIVRSLPDIPGESRFDVIRRSAFTTKEFCKRGFDVFGLIEAGLAKRISIKPK